MQNTNVEIFEIEDYVKEFTSANSGGFWGMKKDDIVRRYGRAANGGREFVVRLIESSIDGDYGILHEKMIEVSGEEYILLTVRCVDSIKIEEMQKIRFKANDKTITLGELVSKQNLPIAYLSRYQDDRTKTDFMRMNISVYCFKVNREASNEKCVYSDIGAGAISEEFYDKVFNFVPSNLSKPICIGIDFGSIMSKTFDESLNYSCEIYREPSEEFASMLDGIKNKSIDMVLALLDEHAENMKRMHIFKESCSVVDKVKNEMIEFIMGQYGVSE
jgi:hypothetical protein